MVRVLRQPMVFKMLILLGFFAAGTRSFIHSDIHRSAVEFEDELGKNCGEIRGVAHGPAEFWVQDVLKCPRETFVL